VAYKYTLLFQMTTNAGGQSQTTRTGGWSESVYKDTINQGAMNALCQTRAAMLPPQALIVGQRIQQVFPAGASQTAGRRYPGSFGSDNDMGQAGMLLTGRARTGANVRRWRIGGVPDDQITFGEYVPKNGWNPLLGAYLSVLSFNFGFMGRDLTARPLAVVSISALGEVLLAEAMTVSPGDEVALRDVLMPNDFTSSGRFKVVDTTDALNFKIRGWKPLVGTGGTALNVTARSYLQFADTSLLTVSHVVSRKIGRPLAGFRGRN